MDPWGLWLMSQVVCAGARSVWPPWRFELGPAASGAYTMLIYLFAASLGGGLGPDSRGRQKLRAPAQTTWFLSQRPRHSHSGGGESDKNRGSPTKLRESRVDPHLVCLTEQQTTRRSTPGPVLKLKCTAQLIKMPRRRQGHAPPCLEDSAVEQARSSQAVTGLPGTMSGTAKRCGVELSAPAASRLGAGRQT